MFTRSWLILAALILGVALEGQLCAAQPKGPVDVDKAILWQIREAYKSVYEVPKDLHDELRGYYKNPTPQREAAILKEVRRRHVPTAEQEQAILFEVRKAAENWSAQQEARIYKAIDMAYRLPEGAVSPNAQATSMAKLFARLDTDGDGRLSYEEMPDLLRENRKRFDRNRDGYISPQEFQAFYVARLGWLSEQVSNGDIDLNLKRGGPTVNRIVEIDDAQAKAQVLRAGKLPPGLPDWFMKLDTDQDGQIGLYEWRAAGKSIEDFLILDLNDDGFITAEEVLRYLVNTKTSEKSIEKK